MENNEEEIIEIKKDKIENDKDRKERSTSKNWTRT